MRIPGLERERVRLARLDRIRSDAEALERVAGRPPLRDWEQERRDVARVRSLSRQYFEENQARLRRLWEGVK